VYHRHFSRFPFSLLINHLIFHIVGHPRSDASNLSIRKERNSISSAILTTKRYRSGIRVKALDSAFGKFALDAGCWLLVTL